MSMQVYSPKFSAENIEKNNVLRERVVAIAEKKKCSLNQLALAWVMHKGKDVVPIPGTTKRANLESNIGSVAISLTKEEIAEIEAAVPANEVAGERVHERLMKLTWLHAVSPPLSSWKGSKVY
jgi:aryl-alcohol dehydrogenase-like predicted oxidoreductase